MARPLTCTPVRRPARGTGVSALVVVGALLATGAACDSRRPVSPPRGAAAGREEDAYDQAVRRRWTISGSRLLLGGAPGRRAAAVWPHPGRRARTEPCTSPRRRRAGGSSAPPCRTARSARTRSRSPPWPPSLDAEEAVEQVKGPDFGKVTGMRLEGGPAARGRVVRRRHHRPAGADTQTYLVDAVTKDVLDRRTAPPSA
ncbi:hypothetical protein LV779_07200 [Streptomyces thinghirensis]|nr:hypothetical protein [Streptomyces thinghirensis]